MNNDVVEICLNYNANTISITGEDIIHVSKKNNTRFNNGAYLYIGLFEVLLRKMYLSKDGDTFSFNGRFPRDRDRVSHYVKALNSELPDYLEIKGGNRSLGFTDEIKKYLIRVSVVATGSAADDRKLFNEWLKDVDWDSINKENEELFESNKTKSPVRVADNLPESWDVEALKVAVSDYKKDTFDSNLMASIHPYGKNLYDYITKTLVSSADKRICIVEGEGGAGKTTSMKYSAYRLIEKGSTAVIVYAYQLQQTGKTICDYIAEHYVTGLTGCTSAYNRLTVSNLAKWASNKNKLFILIDGIDELSSKYYGELLGDDINSLIKECPENLYFVLSTRQRETFVELCDLREKYLLATTNRIDSKLANVSDNYKELLHNYPQFRTPLFILMMRSIMKLEKDRNPNVVTDYGQSEIKPIINKTQLFDSWMELRVSHSAELGIKPYYYTHLLTLTAFISLNRYMTNGDRTIPGSFFDLSDNITSDVPNIQRELNKYSGKIRNKIDLGFNTERLIKIFLGTGLLVTNDNENYMFANMEYMLYLAGYYDSLLFIQESHGERLKRIELLTSISEEKTNPNLALVSYPEFAFNRIMDAVNNKKCKINDVQRKALLTLGLAIGYERVRDVDYNIKLLMDWYMKNCRKSVESIGIVWRFNAALYSMLTKWNSDPVTAEKHLSYIKNCYDWMMRFFGDNPETYINKGVLPVDFEARIMGNRGGVELEYARYYEKYYDTDKCCGSDKEELIYDHLINALNYHNEAYQMRKDTDIFAGIARSIIGMSTDLYYMAKFLVNKNVEYRADLIMTSIFGGDGPNGMTIPGYLAAANMQGHYDIDTYRWKRNDLQILRECEPCLIFRRMANNSIFCINLVGEMYKEVDLLKMAFEFMKIASYEMWLICQSDNAYSESALEFLRKEINDFVSDIKGFLKTLYNYKNSDSFDDVVDKLELVIQTYNELHKTNVRIDRKKCILINC